MIVVKVGGSLLRWPGLPGRLAAEARGAGVLVVVGGGRFVDAVRDLDEVHGLGEERSHALAMRTLDLTAQVLADLVPGSEVVDRFDQISGAHARGALPILAPRRFLEADDAGGDPLPHRWTTTSDAIAARVAARLGAVGLVVLKSGPIPEGLDAEGAAKLGLVDPEFPRAARDLARVRFVHAQDPGGGSWTLAGRDPGRDPAP